MEDFCVSEVESSFDLEAKRKDDSSWHPCRVSLSSSGDSVIVNFGRQEMEDMLLKKEEVVMHLRFRSMPLQFDDCFRIEEGERVLAYCKSQSENLFRDADVEKVDRIQHSKRGCRCAFLIKWLDHDLKGKCLSVPSSSIMKLSTKSIGAHQVVHKLLKPEKVACLSFSSPLLTILEGTDDDIDLNKLLEKQIEKISKLADAPEKDLPEDTLWGNRAVPDHHNHLKRTRQSKRKLQVDAEAKDQSGPTASLQEEFIRNRSHLSPLASRAALASSLLTAKKCLDVDFSSCINANKLVEGKNSSEIYAISPLNSTQRDASFKPSLCAPKKVLQNENKISGKSNCNAEDRAFAPAKVTAENVTSGVTNSGADIVTAELSFSTDKKSSADANLNARSTAPIRLTHSAIQRGALIPNDSVQVKICNDDTNRRIPRNKKQLSEPAVCQGNENFANEAENNSTRVIDLDSSKGNIAAAEVVTAELSISRAKRSSVDANLNASSRAHIRLTRLAIQKGVMIPNDWIQVKIFNDNTNRRGPEKKMPLIEPPVCRGNENFVNEEENNSTHVIDSDSSKGNIAAAESNVARMNSRTPENMNAAFTPRKDTDSGRSNQGQKRKAVHPNKEGRQFSPRNFLPRTRSQNKAQPGKYRGTISN